jgi:hypothetical protein
MDIHQGQVGLIAGPTTRVQWAICAFTQEPAFHVVLGLGDGRVISAQPGGVKIEEASVYQGVIWSAFPYTPGQAQAIEDWAVARTGKPYNWVDDGLIGLEATFGWKFPQFITKHWDNGKSYSCGQFADAALWHGGNFHTFRDDRPAGMVSPGSFVPVFKANGWWPAAFWATNPENFAVK